MGNRPKHRNTDVDPGPIARWRARRAAENAALAAADAQIPSQLDRWSNERLLPSPRSTAKDDAREADEEPDGPMSQDRGPD